jgi:multidrug efflux pump subunit AcrA (membrane-fusion protein)
MSSEPTKTPSRRRLLVIALVALTSAGGVAVYGIIQRAHSAAQVAQWTDQQAIPTVALASLQGGPQVRKLTLPGTIQAYYRAAIYARVSGYLQSWQTDIGAHVKAGQLLASIDIPDLDQQFGPSQSGPSYSYCKCAAGRCHRGALECARKSAVGIEADGG